MHKLENNTQITAHRLQWAENQLKEEHKMFCETRMAKMSDFWRSNWTRGDQSQEEDGQSQQSELSDQNIRWAVDNINNLTKCKEEMQSQYNARLAAQVWI